MKTGRERNRGKSSDRRRGKEGIMKEDSNRRGREVMTEEERKIRKKGENEKEIKTKEVRVREK
jgi:hypothetical protein